jgi:hypothetical protein
MPEVRELCEELLALKQLKHGKYLGKDTEVTIAGKVRQLDLFHSPAVAKHDPLLLGRMGELAHRVAATYGLTRATHKIASIKMLVTPACVPGRPPVGEQLVHWDFSNAFRAENMFTMLWHLTAAPGQRTTALPRFPAYCQPDERTSHVELRSFLPPLFDKANYESDEADMGDVSFFDECVPHFGTANISSEERVVVFFMFVPCGTSHTNTHIYTHTSHTRTYHTQHTL